MIHHATRRQGEGVSLKKTVMGTRGYRFPLSPTSRERPFSSLPSLSLISLFPSLSSSLFLHSAYWYSFSVFRLLLPVIVLSIHLCGLSFFFHFASSVGFFSGFSFNWGGVLFCIIFGFSGIGFLVLEFSYSDPGVL